MTLLELLAASSKGFRMVKASVPINGATSNEGFVVLMKDNGRFKGCAVQFPGLTYDTWFGDEPTGTDKRSHYMHELTLKNPEL